MTTAERAAVSVALEALETQMEQQSRNRTVTKEYEDCAEARKVLREMLNEETV